VKSVEVIGFIGEEAIVCNSYKTRLKSSHVRIEEEKENLIYQRIHLEDAPLR
jgi:hypothetical protein